jgi:hypothetical protein
MLILGIDPGLHVTGYGLIEATRHGFTIKRSGFIKTRMKDELPKRLSQIHVELAEILDRYKPDALVLEKLYAHYKHPLRHPCSDTPAGSSVCWRRKKRSLSLNIQRHASNKSPQDMATRPKNRSRND